MVFFPVFILLGGGLFGLWFLGHQSFAQQTGEIPTPFYLQTGTDGDGDGLLDWEERLWQSQVNQVDSDGDGTNDGAEVKQGRNPILAGQKRENGSWTDALSQPEEKVAASLGQALKNRQIPLTLANPKDLEQSVKSYAEADLKTSADNSVTVQLYATAFKKFATALLSQNPLNPVALVLAYGDRPDTATIISLKNMSTFYQQQAEALVKTSVPTNAVAAQLALVNSLRDLGENVGQMALVATEPVLALQATQVYTDKVYTLVKALKKIDQYFYDQNFKLDQ